MAYWRPPKYNTIQYTTNPAPYTLTTQPTLFAGQPNKRFRIVFIRAITHVPNPPNNARIMIWLNTGLGPIYGILALVNGVQSSDEFIPPEPGILLPVGESVVITDYSDTASQLYFITVGYFLEFVGSEY